MDFDCGEPFERDGMEWVLLTIKGASFMLHQIRKMVGLCIAVMQGFASVDVFDSVFKPGRMDVPIAPGLGLMLEKVVSSYGFRILFSFQFVTLFYPVNLPCFPFSW